MSDFGIVDESTGETDPRLDRVRKLLAKAQAEGCTDAEREALNAKANEMIAKYGIDAAMAKHGRVSEDDMALKEYEIHGEHADEVARLLVRLAEALGCQGILTYDGATVVGYYADIQRMEVLYTSLSLQMHSGAVRVGGGITVRRGWMNGFSDTVAARIREAEGNAKADAGGEGSSTALVLQSRAVAVKKAFREEFPNVSYSRSRANLAAYGAGAAAGRSADIGGTRVGGGRKALG